MCVRQNHPHIIRVPLAVLTWHRPHACGIVLLAAWAFLLLPLWYICAGLLVALALATVLGIPRDRFRSFLICIAFGSGSTLPVILLDLIGADDETFASGHGPLLYLSFYLITYPMLQVVGCVQGRTTGQSWGGAQPIPSVRVFQQHGCNIRVSQLAGKQVFAAAEKNLRTVAPAGFTLRWLRTVDARRHAPCEFGGVRGRH